MSETAQSGTLRQRLLEALLGLQFRATCGVVGLTFAMVGLVCWLFVGVTGKLTGRLQREQCAQLSAVLGQAAADAMERGDRHALDTLAHQFVEPSTLPFVTFFDPSGKVVATADVDAARLRRTQLEGMKVIGERTLGSPRFVRATGDFPAYLDVTYPIHKLLDIDLPRAGESVSPERMALLGYVRLGLNVESSLHELSTSTDLVTGTAILIAMVTVPLGFLLVRHVVEPINDLSSVTDDFAGGNLGVRSGVNRHDEIGRLACAFNRMADQHERNHDQLVRLNAELEDRVSRRTQQLRELASRDPLTGLYNRRHFNEVLSRRASEATRYDIPLSCLMFDLDDFKHTNDTHGHQVGDDVLVLTALTITSQLRAADVAARFGGDEFVVLLPQTTAERARTLSERIVEKLAADVAQKLPDVNLTVSVGISNLGGIHSDDPDELIRAADRAMYTAKSEGKARIVADAALGG